MAIYGIAPTIVISLRYIYFSPYVPVISYYLRYVLQGNFFPQNFLYFIGSLLVQKSIGVPCCHQCTAVRFEVDHPADSSDKGKWPYEKYFFPRWQHNNFPIDGLRRYLCPKPTPHLVDVDMDENEFYVSTEDSAALSASETEKKSSSEIVVSTMKLPTNFETETHVRYKYMLEKVSSLLSL